MSTQETKQYFTYDPAGDGMTYHDTEEQAKAQADLNLQEHKDIASSDGWLEDDVQQLSWGRVLQSVEEVDRKERPPESELDEGVDQEGRDFSNFETWVDYQYRPRIPS